ncbi:MAG: 3'-5' exoribonuclease [Acidobacteria bacterium]|nr:3'-5' exoribonuclease [Acidobacteriota bacterium]
MPPFPNLISDSVLIKDAIRLLALSGGRAPAVKVVDRVMRIRKPDPTLAKRLVADLVERDTRLALHQDEVVYIEQDRDSISFSDAEFVVIDLETTGAKAPPCRVTEIGAYSIKKGTIADEFRTLVNPEAPIPPFITALTGINDEMVRDAPRFGDIADDLLGFIGDAVVVAHNAQFDMGFLDHEIGRVYEDYRLGNPTLCTVKLSRRLLPQIENHKLNTVARHYSIDLVNHHRASDDAKATAEIFLHFIEEMSGIGIYDIGGANQLSRKKLTLKTKYQTQ